MLRPGELPRQNALGKHLWLSLDEALELIDPIMHGNARRIFNLTEKQDFKRRQKRVKTKKICKHKDIELIEPGVEMGVIALFNQIYALEPSLFPFRVIDYDTKRGYDALVSQGTPTDLSKETMFFVEFKYMLTSDFSHSFDHLTAIICWDSKLAEGAEVRDIQDKRRTLTITPEGDDSEYTRYVLVSSRELHNIEVFVLKNYVREKLGIEFKHRSEKH